MSESASTIQSEEKIHQAYDGSFTTESVMVVTVPEGERVEDVVVQCVASHPTLGQASVEAVHVVRVNSKLSSGSSSQISVRTYLQIPQQSGQLTPPRR